MTVPNWDLSDKISPMENALELCDAVGDHINRYFDSDCEDVGPLAHALYLSSLATKLILNELQEQLTEEGASHELPELLASAGELLGQFRSQIDTYIAGQFREEIAARSRMVGIEHSGKYPDVQWEEK